MKHVSTPSSYSRYSYPRQSTSFILRRKKNDRNNIVPTENEPAHDGRDDIDGLGREGFRANCKRNQPKIDGRNSFAARGEGEEGVVAGIAEGTGYLAEAACRPLSQRYRTEFGLLFDYKNVQCPSPIHVPPGHPHCPSHRPPGP